jgi:hypothetical protein
MERLRPARIWDASCCQRINNPDAEDLQLPLPPQINFPID